MFAVKGLYDGDKVHLDYSSIPIKEKCEVIITFLDTDKNYEGNSYFKKQSGFDFDYEKGIS